MIDLTTVSTSISWTTIETNRLGMYFIPPDLLDERSFGLLSLTSLAIPRCAPRPSTAVAVMHGKPSCWSAFRVGPIFLGRIMSIISFISSLLQSFSAGADGVCFLDGSYEYFSIAEISRIGLVMDDLENFFNILVLDDHHDHRFGKFVVVDRPYGDTFLLAATKHLYLCH